MVIGASGKYRQFKPIGSNGYRFNCSKSAERVEVKE